MEEMYFKDNAYLGASERRVEARVAAGQVLVHVEVEFDLGLGHAKAAAC